MIPTPTVTQDHGWGQRQGERKSISWVSSPDFELSRLKSSAILIKTQLEGSLFRANFTVTEEGSKSLLTNIMELRRFDQESKPARLPQHTRPHHIQLRSQQKSEKDILTLNKWYCPLPCVLSNLPNTANPTLHHRPLFHIILHLLYETLPDLLLQAWQLALLQMVSDP